MAKIRLNIGVSEFLVNWAQTQPAIQAISASQNYVEITHTMTPSQLSTFKTNFINRLTEDI